MADFSSGGAAALEVVAVESLVISLTDIIYVGSADPVEVSPSETRKIVSHTEADTDWVITAIGATDNDYSEYYLKIGDDESTHTKSPFGLFNNPHKFEPTLEVPKGVEAAYFVSLSGDAPGPAEYVAKFIGYKKE